MSSMLLSRGARSRIPLARRLQQLIASVDAHFDRVAVRRWCWRRARSTFPSTPSSPSSPPPSYRVVGAAAVHHGPPKTQWDAATGRRSLCPPRRRAVRRSWRDRSARRFCRAPRRDPRGRRRGGGDGGGGGGGGAGDGGGEDILRGGGGGDGVRRQRLHTGRASARLLSTCSSVPMDAGARRARRRRSLPSPTKLLDGTAGLESVEEGAAAARDAGSQRVSSAVRARRWRRRRVRRPRRGGSRRRCVPSTASRGRCSSSTCDLSAAAATSPPRQWTRRWSPPPARARGGCRRRRWGHGGGRACLNRRSRRSRRWRRRRPRPSNARLRRRRRRRALRSRCTRAATRRNSNLGGGEVSVVLRTATPAASLQGARRRLFARGGEL